MKLYVVAITKFGDEFTEGVFDTIHEAIQCADAAWYHLTRREQKEQTIEVRKYSEDIEDDGCECFDYDTIDWQNGTKFYMSTMTGDIFSIEEIKERYEDFKGDLKKNYDTFEDYFSDIKNDFEAVE